MSALSGFFDRLRGQLAEIGEAVSGSQALRMLDQEIRTTDEQLQQWRRMRDTLKAQRLTAQEQLDATVAKLLQRESQGVAALQAGHDKLARDVATAIVDLEQARGDLDAQLGLTDVRMAELQHLIERGQTTLRRLKHRLDLVQAAQTVAKAEQSMATSSTGEAMRIPTAVESADLLRQRNAQPDETRSDSPRAGSVEDLLDARLEAAGLAPPDSPIDAVLERLSLQVHVTKPGRRRTSTDLSKAAP